MPETKKRKAIGTAGFRRVFIGIMDQDEKVTKVVKVDETSGGAIDFKATGFTGQSNVVYASNIAYWISDAGTGTGKIELSTVELPDDVSTAVLGDEVDENGIYVTKSDVKQPYVAIIAEAQDLEGNPMWIGVGKAKFGTTDGDELKTAEDKGMTPNNVSLSAQAITRKSDKIVKAKATASNGTTLEQFAAKMFPSWSGDLENIDGDSPKA
ncbi:tail protein [Latilactobacillus curvatus]|uniref:major tail protein n=1 Tax=Latilactobacillus curvatus TaxID=28038 RepID=UPI000DBB12C8|nr:major tail protein [Latilactobacillus curvatus]WBY48554.1 phage tail protein [Latilactobacillus curvatus]BBE26717.1 tail protein [Latilactobacillus curvatus]